jgi:hypothetical protein
MIERILENNLLSNCPATRSDIARAEDIFAPDFGSLKGKTVRQTPGSDVKNTDIPPYILGIKNYGNVTLAADILFINRLAFLVTISRNVKFSTCEFLKDMKANTILHGILQVIGLFQSHGFTVTHLLLDEQVGSIQSGLISHNIVSNIIGCTEHVPEAERRIRTIKERARSTIATLPFKYIPRQMMVELIYGCIFWLNSFPAADGVSTTISPRTIMTGLRIDYHKHCQFFCEYIQTHEQRDNSMQSRTIGAIALRPTGNIQGGYQFFSLLTGKIMQRYNWTRLPMPNEVINRIDTLAKEEINSQSHEEMILPNKANDSNCNDEENQSTNTPESLYYETLGHQHNNAEEDILDDQLENEDESEAENQMDEDVQDPIIIAVVNDNDDEDSILAENVEVVDVLPDTAREYEESGVAMDQSQIRPKRVRI